MSTPIAANLRKPISGDGTEPVTIVDFVTVGAGQVFGVFIRENGKLDAAPLASFSACRSLPPMYVVDAGKGLPS